MKELGNKEKQRRLRRELESASVAISRETSISVSTIADQKVINELASQLRMLANRFSSKSATNSERSDRSEFQHGILRLLKSGGNIENYITGECILRRIKMPLTPYAVKPEKDFECPAGLSKGQKTEFKKICRRIAKNIGLEPITVAAHLSHEIQTLASALKATGLDDKTAYKIIIKNLEKSNLFSIQDKFNAVTNSFKSQPLTALVAADLVLSEGKYRDGHSAAAHYSRALKEAEGKCKDIEDAKVVALEVLKSKSISVSAVIDKLGIAKKEVKLTPGAPVIKKRIF